MLMYNFEFLLYENMIWFFFYFSMFWRKPDILISDLYLYGIKTQTNIKQNSVEKYSEKSQIFWNVFFGFFGLGRTRPNYFDVTWPGPVIRAGPELAQL
jgi:hypothetical protein